MTDPQEINGSALGARDVEELDREASKKLGHPITEEGDIDKVWAKKYPANDPNFGYLLDGCISVIKDEGKFLLGSFDRKKTPGAVLIDQTRNLFTSMASETKLGSTVITTLDGKVMNPSSMPSSAMTPQKTWLQDIIPSFRDLRRIEVIAMFTALAAVAKSDKSKNNKVVIDARKKDVGTIIIDNQEIEERILNGSV